MGIENNDVHDMLRIMGKIGKHDATLWIHSNGDFDNLKFIVCVECRGHEWDFHNICEAWLWFWEEQARQKQRERSRRADYQRKRYWKKHTSNMEGGVNMNLSDAARELRNKRAREYYANHKRQQAEYNRRYWERQAAKAQAEAEAAQNNAADNGEKTNGKGGE